MSVQAVATSQKKYVMWCQWPDLITPPSFTVISNEISTLTRQERESISIYVPLYMGGKKVLAAITTMPNLKFVQLLNAGYDDVLEYLRPGMLMCRAGGVHNDSTAELALTLTLASLRGVPEYVRNQINGIWNHERNQSLSDKKVAIVGYGSIGKSIENLFSSFPITIERFARTARENIHAITDLDSYLPDIDVVILITPLTPETKHLFDAARINKMKKGALLVNVARGGVIDTDALVSALKAGKISAALDVTDPEPLPEEHPLWKLENCLILPHVGGNSTAFDARARKLVEKQLIRFVNGQELESLISWENK